jgi:hypothetical protein
MDPAMQQFFQTQTQLLQNLANTVANLQAEVNNSPVQQLVPLNKHREFTSHHPQCSPMQLIHLRLRIGWKTVLKMLTTAQCSDREKVLYAAGQPLLRGMHMLMLMLP